MSVLNNEKPMQLTSLTLVEPRLMEINAAIAELQSRLNNVVTILEGTVAPCAVGVAQNPKPVRGGLIGDIETQLRHLEDTLFGCEHLLTKAEQLVGKPTPRAPAPTTMQMAANAVTGMKIPPYPQMSQADFENGGKL